MNEYIVRVLIDYVTIQVKFRIFENWTKSHNSQITTCEFENVNKIDIH